METSRPYFEREMRLGRKLIAQWRIGTGDMLIAGIEAGSAGHLRERIADPQGFDWETVHPNRNPWFRSWETAEAWLRRQW
jgi:hypothetical protein